MKLHRDVTVELLGLHVGFFSFHGQIDVKVRNRLQPRQERLKAMPEGDGTVFDNTKSKKYLYAQVESFLFNNDLG